MKHEVKIWTQYFERVLNGSKTFEIRKNDRGYQAGDQIVLNDYDEINQKYTGRKLEFTIGYVIPIDAERVIFSLIGKQKQYKQIVIDILKCWEMKHDFDTGEKKFYLRGDPPGGKGFWESSFIMSLIKAQNYLRSDNE